jgi:hypothetical protein
MLPSQRLQKHVCQDNTALRLSSQIREMLDEATEVCGRERRESKPGLQFQKVFAACFGTKGVLRPQLGIDPELASDEGEQRRCLHAVVPG